MAKKKKKIESWDQLQSAKHDLKEKHEEELEKLEDEENELFNETSDRAKDVLTLARTKALLVLTTGMSAEDASGHLSELLGELYHEG
jgi:ElaB/YqjD/DUF883 family membrane-anchored ribosome-binding protein